MSKTIRLFTITIITFSIYYLLSKLFLEDFRDWLTPFFKNKIITYIIAYLILGTPLYLGVLIMHKKELFFESLGLKGNLKTAIIFTLICTSPMLIGNAIGYQINSELKLESLVLSVFFAPFIEELFFRGFLFGQIFKYTKIGFIPSIIFGALIFASGHVHQSTDLTVMVGIFITTFIGAIIFAWVYVEWNYNLWVPIFLHLFMNLSWIAFSASSNALGNIYVNIFRVITILLVFVLTIIYKKKKGIPFVVNKQTFWIKKNI